MSNRSDTFYILIAFGITILFISIVFGCVFFVISRDESQNKPIYIGNNSR